MTHARSIGNNPTTLSKRITKPCTVMLSGRRGNISKSIVMGSVRLRHFPCTCSIRHRYHIRWTRRRKSIDLVTTDGLVTSYNVFRAYPSCVDQSFFLESTAGRNEFVTFVEHTKVSMPNVVNYTHLFISHCEYTE